MKFARLLSAATMVAAVLSATESEAQIRNSNQLNGGDGINTITTAVPFLQISPDSRAGGMGDLGVATSPDANSIHWNPAKLGFVKKNVSIAASYTPWLRNLVPDISLAYLSGYKRLDRYSVIGGSLRYFSLGDIQFTDQFGNATQQFNPNEFALDVAFSRKLTDRLSGGIAARYIYSNLTGGQTVQGASSRAGQAFAMDVSAYYQNDDAQILGNDGTFAFGAAITNIGNKMSYTETTKRDFIPINLRLGPRFTVNLDDYNTITWSVEVNKLLVPTPPIYERDSNGQPLLDQSGNFVILSGNDPDRGVPAGMFGAFTDAPGSTDANGNVESGSVFREELREFNIATGLEYWYDQQFAFRAGYFWEHQLKGNRKYFTLGLGLRYNVFGLDFSYLIPAYFDSSQTQTSPLANTLRFTLMFDFDAFKSQNEGEGQ